MIITLMFQATPQLQLRRVSQEQPRWEDGGLGLNAEAPGWLHSFPGACAPRHDEKIERQTFPSQDRHRILSSLELAQKLKVNLGPVSAFEASGNTRAIPAAATFRGVSAEGNAVAQQGPGVPGSGESSESENEPAAREVATWEHGGDKGGQGVGSDDEKQREDAEIEYLRQIQNNLASLRLQSPVLSPPSRGLF